MVNRVKQDLKKATCKVSSPLDTIVMPMQTAPMSFLPLHQPTKWNDRLAFDVALTLEGSGESLQEVVTRHAISVNDVLNYNADPVFLKKVEHYRGEIREKGITFKLKARAQAEELLTTSWVLIHDPAVSPAVKADLIKSTVKWAGLEPKNEVTAEGSSGGVKITINLGSAPSDARTIEATTIDAEEADALTYED